ncbi:MAG: type II and III secretion system protein [Campylobacterota bacterium]|nr:type II and III secretion system protein [Campylobacterota bacterium]
MKKILLIVFLLVVSLQADAEFMIKGKEGQRVTLVKSDFKVLEFDKRIVDVLVSDSTKLKVFFIKNKKKPLQTLKLYAKELGYSKLLITFDDKSTLLNEVSIVQNFSKIIETIKAINKDINVEQANGKVILKGFAADTKEKDKIVNLFESAGVDIKKDMINLLEVRKPNKMIRIKLYVTEINNDDGLEIKNNWFASSKNYMEYIDADDKYANSSLSEAEAGFGNTVNNQRNSLVSNAVDNIMLGATSLTGGLTGAANYLGKYFNVGFTLNYLATEGIATILDETTLITLENKKSVFHAGGKIYVKTQTTTSEGIPSTLLKEIDYGLKLEVMINNIINDKFVDMTITTRQDKIDWSRQVDGIPAFTNQSINTFVIVQNQATIVLGGLVNQNDAKNYSKIPLLGDIPILGKLFQSKNFQSGKSELVFFIVPEIVDPSKSDEIEILNQTKSFMEDVSVDKDKVKKADLSKGVDTQPELNDKKQMTNQELHKKRLNEIFGIN